MGTWKLIITSWKTPSGPRLSGGAIICLPDPTPVHRMLQCFILSSQAANITMWTPIPGWKRSWESSRITRLTNWPTFFPKTWTSHNILRSARKCTWQDGYTCKGCNNKYELPVEPDFAYKLNDLVKNNIFQTPTSRDGNLTVIRTLSWLSNHGFNSFGYTAQLNLFSGVHPTKICGDIDIFCIENGKLIIGEAKHDSKAFAENHNKSLKSLVEVAKDIRPDKVVLSCSEDTNDKLAKAKQGLIHAFDRWEFQPEIETIELDKPDSYNLGGHRYFYYWAIKLFCIILTHCRPQWIRVLRF